MIDLEFPLSSQECQWKQGYLTLSSGNISRSVIYPRVAPEQIAYECFYNTLELVCERSEYNLRRKSGSGIEEVDAEIAAEEV